jgi:serine/threonine protein kinase
MDQVTTGDFVVGQVLGEGRFATVFHARRKSKEASQQNGPNSVAIKVIEKTTLHRNEGILSAVLQEQRLLRRLTEGRMYSLHSPSTVESSSRDGTETMQERRIPPSFVVPLLASFHDGQFVYMVMECARGTVADMIREYAGNRTDASDNDTAPEAASSCYHWVRIAACLSYQTLQALEYIHTNSVVHCDVKPENLLLSAGGRIQLCDFGSAIDVKACRTESLRTTNRGTGTGSPWRTAAAPRGTSEYSSPELLRGLDSVSFETDLWSLGCVMFALLHGGASPFHAPSDTLAVEKVMNFDSAADEEILSSLPLEWRETVRVFLVGEPRLRWMTPVEHGNSHQSSAERQSSTSLQERYGFLKQRPLWTGSGDIEHLLVDLMPNPKWSLARFEDMRDGNLGWTAFA